MKQKKIFSKLVAFLCLNFVATCVNAQSLQPIDLEAVLKLSGANNLTIQEYQLKYQQALADQLKAKEWWLPTIYAGATTHYLNGAAMNTDGRIFTNINRNYLWAGLGFAGEIDFGKGFYDARAARQRAVSFNYSTAAEKNQIILKAVLAYFDLQAEELKYLFLRNLSEQSDTLAQQIKIQVDAGLRYQSEYQLAKSNYEHVKISELQAKKDWQTQSAMLTNLLNLGTGIKVISADTALVPIHLNNQNSDINSFEKRYEYLALNSELQSFRTMKKAVYQGLLLPKLRTGTDDGAFGAYSKPLYNTYQLNASLLWNLPLGLLTYKGDMKKWNSTISLQQNKIEQFKNQYQQEVSTAILELQTADDQMKIAKEALLLSADALSQSVERQKLGTAKPFEVFQAQQYYIQAEIDYITAIKDYNKAQYSLYVAMGNNL